MEGREALGVVAVAQAYGRLYARVESSGRGRVAEGGKRWARRRRRQREPASMGKLKGESETLVVMVRVKPKVKMSVNGETAGVGGSTSSV